MTAGAARAAPVRAEAAPAPAAEPAAPSDLRLESFADLVAVAGERRELKLKHALETFVRPIRFEPGRIEIALTDEAPNGLAGEIASRLDEWTGRRWMVAVARQSDTPTVSEARETARARLVDDARADPVVAAVFERFPGAEIVDVRVRVDESEPAPGEQASPPPDDGAEDEG
jgi:DNA polymerase-3 subunit gamma/tau